ncbi:unnamed protein product [Adineta ricciae]|uniref:Uncharacterized protein n=1 Tax=Adineta ricciae TaxID=249248 RepID=A0A816GKH2_ADIRI|nr:unnamed protein product [Adineta ricciae]
MENVDSSTLIDKFNNNDDYVCIFCSSDFLKKQNTDEWNDNLSRFIEQRQLRPDLHLIYAYFSYSTHELSNTMIIASKESVSTPKSTRKDYSTMNILLYDAWGIGKSTFINALANYFQFETIDLAVLGEPFVFIPVSFLMTISDQFEEKLIELGHEDSNEKRNDEGESVTQQCKSYSFHLPSG